MDVEGWLSMKPFAMKSGRRLHLHWWVTAGVAAAFFVWSFDLIPRVRSAATGSVAKSRSSTPGDADAFLSDDWSGILDEPVVTRPQDSSLADNDPLIHAISSREALGRTEDAEVETTTASRERSRPDGRQTRKDPGVTVASYDVPLSDRQPTTRPAGSVTGSNSVIPADVAAQLRNIDEWLLEDRILDVHAELSRIYWKHKALRALIQERIDHTASLIFTTTDRQFAEPHFVDYGETLESIAKQYDVPWMYLARLNRVTPEKLQAGQRLKIVRGPFGAVVDLDDFRLTVHAHGWYVHHYPIGIGRDEKTPTGEFTVKEKLENPTWYNPDGGVVDADDPDNPLGDYWIGLGNHIGIHGTNDPESIGRAASRGCLHLNDEDIAEVFALLSVRSKVVIRK